LEINILKEISQLPKDNIECFCSYRNLEYIYIYIYTHTHTHIYIYFFFKDMKIEGGLYGRARGPVREDNRGLGRE
jgi:hypothetical protein